MYLPLRTAAAAFALLAAPVLSAQAPSPDATTLFDFEGFGGDVQGWEPNEAPDTSLPEGAQSRVEPIENKAINGQGDTIDAYEGTWMLNGIANRPLLAHTFRGMSYTWSTPQDFSETPLLSLYASMEARGANSEIHQFRIRAASGTDTLEVVYTGLKSDEFDADPNNTFVNAWQRLELDMFGWSGVTSVDYLEATGRNFDDGTINSPTTGKPTPGPDGNWGGKVQIDLVQVERAGSVSTEAGPEQAVLGPVFPNPSAEEAALSIGVESAQRVRVAAYDALGREVLVAYEGAVVPGRTEQVQFDTSALPPGLYVVRVEGETFAATRRFTVVR